MISKIYDIFRKPPGNGNLILVKLRGNGFSVKELGSCGKFFYY